MANRYGECAIQTVRAETAYRSHPAERWSEVMGRLYPTSEAARRKSAPRAAFLSLCEAGLVKGIPAGSYGASTKEKDKVVRAVELLQDGTQKTVHGLWTAVADADATAGHAGQMDVVMALWKNGLIADRSS